MAIITLASLKTYLGITDVTEDAKLQVIVDATNLSIDKYVGRTLAETEYLVELYDGSGVESLCLRNFPVSEIEEITIYDFLVDPRDDAVAFGHGWYAKDGNEDIVSESGIIFKNDCWPRGRGIIKVSYTAGYETMPADIVFGTLEMASFYRNTTRKTGVLSETLGAYGFSLANSLNAMNGELTIPSIAFKMILDRYRVSYHADLVY